MSIWWAGDPQKEYSDPSPTGGFLGVPSEFTDDDNCSPRGQATWSQVNSASSNLPADSLRPDTGPAVGLNDSSTSSNPPCSLVLQEAGSCQDQEAADGRILQQSGGDHPRSKGRAVMVDRESVTTQWPATSNPSMGHDHPV